MRDVGAPVGDVPGQVEAVAGDDHATTAGAPALGIGPFDRLRGILRAGRAPWESQPHAAGSGGK